MIWKSANGQNFSIDGTDENYPLMSDSHLINIVLMFYKKADAELSELIKNSYGTLDYVNYYEELTTKNHRDYVNSLLISKYNFFNCLLTEIEKRKLQLTFDFPNLAYTKDQALRADDYDLYGEEHPFYQWDPDVWDLSYMGGD